MTFSYKQEDHLKKKEKEKTNKGKKKQTKK